jgi:hypothetical protein
MQIGAKISLTVRINCIELLGLHHLFYKGAAGLLGLRGGATPDATSPGRRLPWSRLPLCRLPWSRPIRVTGVRPIRVYSCAPPHVPPPLGVASPGAGPRDLLPPINVILHLSIVSSNSTAIPLL